MFLCWTFRSWSHEHFCHCLMLFSLDCDDFWLMTMKTMIITSIIIVLITIGLMIVAISTPIMTTIGIAMFVYQNISSLFGNHSCFPKPATQIHPLNSSSQGHRRCAVWTASRMPRSCLWSSQRCRRPVSPLECRKRLQKKTVPPRNAQQRFGLLVLKKPTCVFGCFLGAWNEYTSGLKW